METLDKAGARFLRALDEAGRTTPVAAEPAAIPQRPEAPVSIGFAPGRGGGGEARWDFAMQWTDESSPPLARPAPDPDREPDGPRSEAAAAIAAELGLGATLTPRQLACRWRDFVWRNHPDRQPAHERDRASARVAIANALYDHVRRELARAR